MKLHPAGLLLEKRTITFRKSNENNPNSKIKPQFFVQNGHIGFLNLFKKDIDIDYNICYNDVTDHIGGRSV